MLIECEGTLELTHGVVAGSGRGRRSVCETTIVRYNFMRPDRPRINKTCAKKCRFTVLVLLQDDLRGWDSYSTHHSRMQGIIGIIL